MKANMLPFRKVGEKRQGKLDSRESAVSNLDFTILEISGKVKAGKADLLNVRLHKGINTFS